MKAAVQLEELGRDHRRREQGRSREQAEARQLDVTGRLQTGEALQRRDHRRDVEAIVDGEGYMHGNPGSAWRRRLRIGPFDGIEQRRQGSGAQGIEIEGDGERHRRSGADDCMSLDRGRPLGEPSMPDKPPYRSILYFIIRYQIFIEPRL